MEHATQTCLWKVRIYETEMLRNGVVLLATMENGIRRHGSRAKCGEDRRAMTSVIHKPPRGIVASFEIFELG